ncbi:MAG: integrin alpha [Phycisphaerae bacterium]
MRAVQGFVAALAVMALGGCPMQQAVEYIAGQTGDRAIVSDTASVSVFSPQSDLAITGGTPVEVNWRAVGTTAFAVVDVLIDVDEEPDNGNEIVAFSNLDLSATTETLDTTQLTAGTYYVGVRLEELGEVVTAGYAAGRLIINQRPDLYFTSPRDNFRFDRTPRVNPSFDVSWVVNDPDSTVSVRVYLDPDATPNGNELLLRTSDAQDTDSFTFDLPTMSFEAGTYYVLALVSDGVDTFAFYAPCTILLRSRLAGPIDLRDMYLVESGVRGAIFEGFNPRDNVGSFVATLQDIDNDGFDDFIIVGQFGKPNYESNQQRLGVGEAYLIYGRADAFTGLINLNSAGTLFRAEIYTGVPEVTDPIRPSRGITSFTTLTDWDRDGVREFAFGLPFTDSQGLGTSGLLDPSGYFRSGGVVVVAGSSLRPDLGFPGRNVFTLAEFGTRPHQPQTTTECPQGFGGPKYSTFAGAGPGGSTLFHRQLFNPADPLVGGLVLGCRFSTHEFDDQYGESISNYDFNGLVMSAPNRDASVSVSGIDEVPGAGVVTVYMPAVFAPFFPWSIANSTPANTNLGYEGAPTEPEEMDHLPQGGPYHYVLDDIGFIAAPGLGSIMATPGYTVSDATAPPDCNAVSHGGVGLGTTLTLWTDEPGARLSNAAGIGDVNSDGLQDLLIGAPFIGDGAGACFIVLGRVRGLVRGAELQVEELALPMNSSDPAEERIFDGIRIVGSAGERLGQAQDDAGDFNNDGFGDVVIGSSLLNNRQGGAAVFFGSREIINLTQTDIPFSEIPARGLGVVFVGEEEGDLAGARVCSAGDVDGDGNDDILIAAPNRSIQMDVDLDGELEIDRTECGVVYLIYGSPDLSGTISLSLVGTERLPGAVFIGRNSQDQLGAGLGEQGDRSNGMARAGDVDGDGFQDLLLGAVRASPRDRAQAGEAYLIYGTGN